jgi:hypothetical protein
MLELTWIAVENANVAKHLVLVSYCMESHKSRLIKNKIKKGKGEIMVMA